MTCHSITSNPQQRALTFINEASSKKRKLEPVFQDSKRRATTDTQAQKTSRVFSSKDDLDLIFKPKKISERKALIPLDLAREKDPTQKDLASSLAHKKAMDIIAITGTLSYTPLIRPQKAKEIDEFFYKKKPEPNTIYRFNNKIGEGNAVLKIKHVWKKYKWAKGADHTALISDTEVLKIGHNPQRYKKNQDRLKQIYDQIGNFPRGIQKQPPKERFNPRLFIWNPITNRKFHPGFYHKEYPYKSDLFDLVLNIQLSKDEQLKIYRCLILGSKTFIQNGIYHLDTKLENIGYLENGRAEHFDFGSSIIIDPLTKKLKNNHIYCDDRTTLINDSKKLHLLFKNSNEIELISLSEKIHIFQLGTCFYILATSNYPYHYSNSIILSTHPQKNLKEDLSKKHKPKHVDMIIKMLSEKPEDRPTIDEVELAFQEL